MSELHFDNDGEPAQQHPQCVEVRWRRFRNPGMRGAPEVVHEKDGSQLYTSADITYLEFSTRVNGVPGRYRGDQVDAARRLVPGATPFYVTITEAPRNATTGSPTDDLLRHVISANVRQTEVIAERFAGMMEQAAEMLRQTSEVLRVFTGANLLQRQAPPEPDDDEDDEDDEYDEEDEEPTNAAAAVLKEIKPIADQAFSLFETWLLQRAAKPAAPPPSSLPDAPPTPAEPPPPAVSPPPAEPPPPAPAPSTPPAAPPPVEPVPPPPAPVAPAPAPAADTRNAATVMPTPEQAQHLLAIQAALDPRERTIARTVIKRMTDEQRVDWLRELSALTVDQAVALVRSMIPAPAPRGDCP